MQESKEKSRGFDRADLQVRIKDVVMRGGRVLVRRALFSRLSIRVRDQT